MVVERAEVTKVGCLARVVKAGSLVAAVGVVGRCWEVLVVPLAVGDTVVVTLEVVALVAVVVLSGAALEAAGTTVAA